MNRALKQAAEKVRKQGQRGDKILAHINPAEASYLKKHFGGDKNPKTGLPQYGLTGIRIQRPDCRSMG